MSVSLTQFFEQMFVGPILPASILVGLMLGYTVLAIFGYVDFGFDAPHQPRTSGVDSQSDNQRASAESGELTTDANFLEQWGAATRGWTSFGRVPGVLRVGIFAVVYWTVSFLMWHGFDARQHDPTLPATLVLASRNLVIAIAITKVLIQPLIRYCDADPQQPTAHSSKP